MKKQFLLCKFVLITLFLLGSIPHSCWAFRKMLFSIDGTKSLSMGGAFISIADIENVVSYNPAGLGFNEKPELFLDTISQSSSWFNWSEDIQILAGMAYKNFGIGTTIRYLLIPKSIRTAGNEIEIITPIISYGVKLNNQFSLGLRCKVNYGTGPSLDAGFIYIPIKILSIGLLCTDLVSEERYDIRDDGSVFIIPDAVKPQNLGVGFSLKFPNSYLISFDVHNLIEYRLSIEDGTKPSFELKRSYHLGSEMPISDFLIIRIGVLYENYPHTFAQVSNGTYLYQDSYLVAGGVEFKLNDIKIEGTLGKDINSPSWYISFHGSWTFEDLFSDK